MENKLLKDLISPDPTGPSTLVIPKQDELSVYGQPESLLNRASMMADSLAKVIERAYLAVKIGPGKHLKIEAWETIAAMCGAVPFINGAPQHELDDAGNVVGVRVHAQVLRLQTGAIIGSAYSRCDRSEARWADKPLYALEGMAQTRAMSRALASVFRWIPVLAGYSGTPYEEMSGALEAEYVTEEAPAPKAAKPPIMPTVYISIAQQKRLWAIWSGRCEKLGLTQGDKEAVMRDILQDYGLEHSREIERGTMYDTIVQRAEDYLPPEVEGDAGSESPPF